MKRINNPYWGMFKMEFIGGLQYRAKAISGLCTQFFWGIMYIFLYAAFFKTGNAPNGFTQTQMATYIWLGQSFFALRYIGIPTTMAKEITSGDVCYKFIRPVSLYGNWYTTIASGRLSQTLLRFAPILIIAILLPAGYGLSVPVSIVSFILFLISLILGAILMFAICMFIVYFTFKTMSHRASQSIVTSVVGLLGGMVVPLPLLPQSIQNVLNWLPFRFISDLAYRIYCGNVSTSSALVFIGMQIVWIIIIIGLGVLCTKRMLKNVEIQGG